MESAQDFGKLIIGGLEKACPSGALSCYSMEITKAAAPVIIGVAALTSALGLAAMWKINRNWKEDVREHCQYLEARESYITATTLAIGTITVATTLIFASSSAIPAALIIGGVMLISLAVNHYTHSRLIDQQRKHYC